MQTYSISLGARYFVFFDDLFVGPGRESNSRTVAICQGILDENMEVFWEIEERADIISRLPTEVIQLMFTAGFRIVNIGFEKPTDDSLRLMKKGQRVADAYTAVDKLRQAGGSAIIINGNFILGGPGETEDDCLKTIEFAKSLGIDHATFNILEIYPGAPLWNQLGRTIEGDAIRSFEARYYRSDLLTMERLLGLQRYGYQSFYASQVDLLEQHDTAKHL